VNELSKLSIICDTREQQIHCKEYFEKKNIPTITRKLEIGDYSAQIGDFTLENEIAIERKHNLDELAGNLGQDRLRFEREFIRAKAYGTKVFLLIEDAGWQDIYLHNYRSRLSPKSLMASLMSWQVRFNITVWFCEKENTARLIHQILYYAAREQLLKGRW
jgi:ERCC4-type nuclease